MADRIAADGSPPAASPSGGESEELLAKQAEFNAAQAQLQAEIASLLPSTSPSSHHSLSVDEDFFTKPTNKTLRVYKDSLVEEQSKLIALMGSKHADQGLVQMQQEMVSVTQKKISDEEAQLKAKSKKKVPKVKKATPIKKSNSIAKKGSSRATLKYIGTLEKETISAGIGGLPDNILNEILQDIKKERPGLDVSCFTLYRMRRVLTFNRLRMTVLSN